MKIKELREMSVSELKNELLSVHRELFNLRMQKGTKELTKFHLISSARRSIARIKTILREKQVRADDNE